MPPRTRVVVTVAATMFFRIASAFFVIFVIKSASAFNLDFKIPIIKKGPETSHFGFSVAQHKSYIPGAPDSVSQKYKSWMLVGAPKGENLQPETHKSGALYKCPLTTYEDDCEQVLTDGLKDEDTGKISPPTEDEIKDDQWMGVTLKSQGEGGNILVCAHRYQHKGVGEQNYQWGYGLCYRLDDQFLYEETYQPCLGKPVVRGHEQFGYCQTGTSGVILEDEVLLGLPGTYNWRGTLTTRNITKDYLFRDKTEYFGIYTDRKSPVDKYSYLGYSVAAGKFFNGKTSYVAGAPRSQGTGQVIFFSRKKIGNPIMNYELILNGETFASSFGFEVLAMDTNDDAYDDLVVSAPFYFTPKSSGAVYIYVNGGRDKGISNETPFTRLEGPEGESRFGFSMTSLGDLNADGYNDLAVGAPYDDKGAIYIYLGSKDGIHPKHVQEIRAEDLPGLSYDAFGYALSGGLDLDGNNYPDLLTSSFCSDRVILLRARPIVSITTHVDQSKMNNIDPHSKGCSEDRRATVPCFSFKTCFKMTNDAGTQTSLEVRYNISEIVYKDQPVHRIKFHRSLPDKPSTIEQLINLRPDNMGKQQCFDEVVYLREDIRDVLRPMKFKLTYEINQQEPKPVAPGRTLPNINDYPILNRNEAIRFFEATFARDCGSDDICMTDLVVRAAVDLEKHATEDYHVFELGKRQFFNLTVRVYNEGEAAYEPSLHIEHDKAIDLSLRESQTGSYQCAPARSGLVSCKLDNPLLNTTGPIHFVFKPSGLPFKTRFIRLFIYANSTSEDVNYENNNVQFDLEVKRRAEISIRGAAEPEQVFYSGGVTGESAMDTLEEVGTVITHKYLIDNGGPWKVEELKVKIRWPYQVENNKRKGKWLLYLTHIPIVDGDGECDVNPRYVNPLSLEYKQLQVDAEVETGNSDHYRGYTTEPSVSSTTKITKSKKEYISSKKTYTKTSVSSSSSSSSSSRTENEDHFSQGRTQDRKSRKVYTGNNKKPAVYEDNEDDYENYDNFFYPNKEDKKTETIEVSISSENRRLNTVEDIRTMKEGGKTFLNGYDGNKNLVWSSRNMFGQINPITHGSSGNKVTEYSHHKIYTSSSGDRIDFRDNNELLSDLMPDIVDFQIVSDGERSWVNGYDSDNRIVWSSKTAVQEGDFEGKNYKKEYSYSESTRNGKGKRVWSSSVTDGEGIRSLSGSSNIDRSRDFDDRNRHYEATRPESDYDRNYDEEGNRWGSSGGFKKESSSIRKTSYSSSSNNYDEPESSSFSESNKSSLRRYERDQPSFHGNTYARAIVNPETGTVDVVTQKLFSRRSGDQWQEVIHGPYHEENWSSSKKEDHLRPLKRTKREREYVIKAEAIRDPQSGKTMNVVSFTCDGENPTAKCFTFTCTIRNLGAEQSASIRIPSRLWNSTLVEDYPQVSYVSIKSKGEIYLPEEIRLDQDPADDVDYAETLAYSNLFEQLPVQEVPWWVIIVSVLAGLLLLVIIAIVLYKLGFFKRKRPDPTLSGNLDRDINGYN